MTLELLLAANMAAAVPQPPAQSPAHIEAAPTVDARKLNPVDLDELVPVDPATYVPITAEERVAYSLRGAIGLKSLGAGVINAGIGTWRDQPEEWGPHWEGYGRRLASRQATLVLSNSIEATTGALWGEDPRYYRSGRTGAWPRISWAISSSFLNYRSDGERHFAWARVIGMTAGRGISNSWRPESERKWWQSTLQPFGTGFGFRMTSNVFSEFWPDIRRKIGGGRKK